MRTLLTAASLTVYMLLGASGAAATEHVLSGFVEDPPALEPDPDRVGAMRWMKPGLDLSAYDKVAIDAIEIWYDPNAEHKGIDPDRLKAFTDKFRETIVTALEPDYPVVSKAGSGVLVLRLAVTNVRARKMGIRLYHIGISGVAMKVLEEASGKSILVDNAVLEAELLDSQSGERLAVLVDRQPQTTMSDQAKQKEGQKKSKLAGQLIPGGEPSWTKITSTLEFYANRLRERLDNAHGK